MSVSILLHKGSLTGANVSPHSNLKADTVFVNSKEDGHWRTDSSGRCHAFVYSLSRVFTTGSATELALQIAQAVDTADAEIACNHSDARPDAFANALHAGPGNALRSTIRTER